MRALAYFQVDQNADPAGALSTTALTLAFESYCADRGHIPLGVFYDEAGVGGALKYADMLTYIRDTGLGYLVVVPTVGHLGLGLRDQVGRIMELDALHCQVLCDDPESPDPIQAAMRLWNGAGAGSRRERIREGMRAKAARGLGLGKPPYGYRVQYDGTFRTVAEEAEVVRSIFRMYLNEDLGVRSVAQRLNDAGQRTRRGQRWSMVTVRDVLRNHAYIGTYRRFGLRITGSYEAIVAPVDFRQVQDRMTSRSPGRRHGRSDPFVLGGLLYCGHCSQRMMGVTRHQTWYRKDGERRRAEYRYYQCQSRINRSQCDYRTVRASEVEERVLAQLRAPAGGNEPSEADNGAASAEARVASRLRGLDRRYVDYVRMAASGALPLERLRPALAELEIARRGMESRMAVLEGGGAALEEAMAAAREKITPAAWELLGAAERQDVARTLLVKTTLKDGQVVVVRRG